MKAHSSAPDLKVGSTVHASSKALSAVSPSKGKQPVKH